MISLCFLEALQDPSIQVGAFLKAIDGNYRVGNSDHFIIEACEYVESFLKFSPKAEIILNIDNDHLDYFKTFENIKNAFVKYVKLLPDDGLLVINGDDKNCLDLPQYTNAQVITYGINNTNVNFYAKNIEFDNDAFASFDVYKNGEFFEKIKLSVPGSHNVLNALACISLCDYYGIDKKDLQSALKQFTGAHRRFEFKGKVNGASIYDDYGHHPTEIVATSKSVANKKHNKSWVVFQPHTYSRTKNLLDDFAHALLNFDNVIVLDIYAARETNTYNISSKDLVDKIISLGKDAKYIPDFNDCVTYLKENVQEDDLILTLGAGTVTQIGPMLLEK
jgi:UDP-N-acetylmuramate--alanine ligase